MAKKKMPPQLLEYFKNKNEKKEDGSKMSDKEKRTELWRRQEKLRKPLRLIKIRKHQRSQKKRNKVIFSSSLSINKCLHIST